MAGNWAPNLVLLTGATGHVGFRTLIHALSAGYAVRAAVRSQAKASALLSHPHIQFLNPGSRLSFVIVPDLAAPSAYDKAAQDVNYIIHIASPLMAGREVPPSQYEAYFVQPAVHGTIGLLEAAKKSRAVRRVVITSSIVALTPPVQLSGLERSERPISPTDRPPFVPGPYKTELAAYAASKIAALQEAEAWIRTKNPDFDVVHLHPSFVLGRNDLAMNTRETLKGTNAIILGIVLGRKMGSNAGASVHSEDVAMAHVRALSSDIPGNASYILSQQARWGDVKDIVQREFPDAVQKRILPNSGSAETHEVAFNTSLTEETFGFSHLGFEDQVKSVVGHYLELQTRNRLDLRRRGHEEQVKNAEYRHKRSHIVAA
jgi:nucleoside-diphosphate-sugar epimerase